MSVSLILLFICCASINGCVDGKKGFGGDGEQEWGYVTVRQNAHMFWWLHYVTPPSQDKNFSVYDKPLLIWLQGGPGSSSTGFGNFELLGPIDIYGNIRNHTWIYDYNVLFIDNPVGTGFSYVEKPTEYSTTNRQIAEDLIVCIRSFFHQFPRFLNVPTYITAESYGGKMGVEFAYLWFKEQEAKNISSNLRGIAIGNAAISPLDAALGWAPFLIATGMVSSDGFQAIHAVTQSIKAAVNERRWREAFDIRLITEDIIQNYTHNMDKYNFLTEVSPKNHSTQKFPTKVSSEERDKLLDELMNGKVKEALNLTVTWGAQREHVFNALHEDRMKPVTDYVEKLLNETTLKVFVYSGQLDMVISTLSTVSWIESLKWKDAEAWKAAPRNVLVVDNVIEGFVKKFNKFQMFWINRAGHMVPRDNPHAAGAMLKRLTSL